MNPETQAPNAEPRKILIIEDEFFIGELYTRALKKAGYDITLITEGAEALKAAETNSFDIILLDLMIPTITGIEILRILKDPKRESPIRSKIIITTNLEQRDDVRTDIEHQADGYLVKAEITPHELVDFVNDVK
jgi:DNA-binding response OmpR family regulator